MRALKAVLRDALARALFAAGVSRPERVCRDKLLILTFHRVLPQELRSQYPLPGLAVTPEELHWILSALLPHFKVHTVSDAVRRLKNGELSRPLLAVSFDDGQWDNLAYAAPVLKALGVPATFYVPTDYIGQQSLLWHDQVAFAWQKAPPDVREALLEQLPGNFQSAMSVSGFLELLKSVPAELRETSVQQLSATMNHVLPHWARLMSWDEVAQLRSMGYEIGSHSCSHALLPQLDMSSQRHEIEHSLKVLQGKLGGGVTSLCYPNGSYNELSIEAAARAGYENAVTTKWGLNDAERPAFELLRCDMDARRLRDRDGRLSHARLAMRLAGLQPGLAA
jgi:peptidoglycan/xylan/chitin deacetylase (PgdA/CDA1 family)